MSIRISSAVSRINDRGALLVFPIDNRELPLSLWTEFFPNVRMRWAWDSEADNRVSEMWQLMKSLSDCRQVVYSKWYQGRATFFSRELFTAMLCLRSRSNPRQGLSETARTLLEVLEDNSPLSTKELKRATDLQGKLHESEYTRSMKELFTHLLIVAFGEVEDGAFPSLAVGSTQLLFEDISAAAADMTPAAARVTIDRLMPAGSHFRRFLDKTMMAGMVS